VQPDEIRYILDDAAKKWPAAHIFKLCMDGVIIAGRVRHARA
jgi:hypothetical protein